MRVLFVEDDYNLGKATQEGLKASFAVDWVRNAEDAEEALLTTEYALIVLDINLPEMSGLDLLRIIRKKRNNIPVLLLTARDAIQHRIEGLNAGADDYLVKPFDLDELLARCSALIRRSQGVGSPQINHHGYNYDLNSKILKKDNITIPLSAREGAILDCLIRNIDKPISKTKIEEAIYDWSNENIESNTIEVHVASLRKKIGHDFIKTIRGVGYIIPQ